MNDQAQNEDNLTRPEPTINAGTAESPNYVPETRTEIPEVKVGEGVSEHVQVVPQPDDFRVSRDHVNVGISQSIPPVMPAGKISLTEIHDLPTAQREFKEETDESRKGGLGVIVRQFLRSLRPKRSVTSV